MEAMSCLSMHDRIIVNKAKFMYKVSKRSIPDYVVNMFEKYRRVHMYILICALQIVSIMQYLDLKWNTLKKTYLIRGPVYGIKYQNLFVLWKHLINVVSQRTLFDGLNPYITEYIVFTNSLHPTLQWYGNYILYLMLHWFNESMTCTDCCLNRNIFLEGIVKSWVIPQDQMLHFLLIFSNSN